jgi:HSP20 family protein
VTDARSSTLAQRDPLLAELDAMAADMDRFFGRRAAPLNAKGWLPPVDVWETDDEVVIELDVPGCSAENLAAEIVNGQLVVSGERQASEGAVRRYRSERWQGRFVRSFQVPAGIDPDGIDADYHDGVLVLRLKKPDTVKPRRIEIGRQQEAIAAGA